jgi:prepilin-type N-terminal cleavage/methylation domain-containing protein
MIKEKYSIALGRQETCLSSPCESRTSAKNMKSSSLYPVSGQGVSQLHHSSPDKSNLSKQSNRRRSGFTLIELMIVVTVIGILVAIALPNFMRSRTTARVRLCITNLRQLGESKQICATDYRKTATAIPTSDEIAPYLRANNMPSCRASGTYRLRRIVRTPVCSLSTIGHTLDPDEDGLPD